MSLPACSLVWVLALPAFAQSPLTVVQPSQIPGIQTDGPATPAFVEYVSHLSGDPDVNAALLSRSMLVTNNTDRLVSNLVVRFEYPSPSGKIVSKTLWQEPRSGFHPGESRLVTLSAKVKDPDIVRASLDSVLFSDGEFYGPDLFGAWAKLVEEQQFVRATRVYLENSGRDMQRVQQKLEEIHKSVMDRKPEPGEGSSTTMLRERIYGELNGPARNGYERFAAELQARFGEAMLPVLTRKF
jgi:hypothetical protein